MDRLIPGRNWLKFRSWILVHAADKAPVLERYDRLREGGRPAEAYPFRIVNKKGKDIWVRFATAPIIWRRNRGCSVS